MVRREEIEDDKEQDRRLRELMEETRRYYESNEHGPCTRCRGGGCVYCDPSSYI